MTVQRWIYSSQFVNTTPLKWFECYPVEGNNIITMYHLTCIIARMLTGLIHNVFMTTATKIVQVGLRIQPESGKNVSVIWSGNTYNFRTVLDVAGVQGAFHDKK